MKNGLSGLLLTLALALLMGCPASSSGTGSVQLAVSVPQPLASSVSRVSVTFSAEDAPSFSVELLAANGSWRGFLSNLPAGNNRTFLAQAFDASGAKLFEGSASGVTLFADQTAWVAVTLQRVDAPPPFQNAAPFIDSLAASSTSVMADSALALVASAHDPNAGDTLSYAWTSTAGSFSSSTEATTAWTAPDSAGLQTLTLTVTDPGGLTSRLALTIHVLPSGGHGEAQFSILFNNAPEVMTLSAAPTRLTAGQATAVSASASDMDGDTLAYAWSASCEGTWSNASSRSAQFTPSLLPQASCNNCRLTVTVSDGRGGQTTGTVALCVSEPPAPQHFPPFFTSATRSSESATSGQVLTFDVSASDPQDSALSFSWSATLGTLGTPASTASSSRVTWTAPQCVSDGSAPVLTATVTNSFGLTATHRFTVPGLPACSMGWALAGSMSTPRGGHTATVLSSGKVLVAGGQNTQGSLTAAELYDPASRTWSTAASMTQRRYHATATRLNTGKVLVSGGIDGSTPLAAAELYDPASGSWSATAPMTSARYEHTATLLPDGRVLVSGGRNASGVLKTAEVYDPASGTWSTAGAMATPRYFHTAALLNTGKVLVAGGSSNGSTVLATAELYDPASGTWSDTAPMASPRWSHTAALLSSGKVLVTGGRYDASVLAAAELYEPASGSWSTAGTMASPHFSPAVAVLQNGKVLVSGGQNSSGHLAAVELYNPVAGTWSAAPAMNAPHNDHTATLLPNGQVLVAGGRNNSGFPTSAEAYGLSGRVDCATDAHCEAGFYCVASACVTKKADGETCTGANQCSGAQCMGGICCSTCQWLPPRLSSVSPAQAKAGTLVTLMGADFVPGITGRIGSTSCTSTVFVSSTSATCTVPTLTNGTYAITVTHPDGLSSTLAAALIYDSTPPAGGGTLNDGIASNSLTTSPTLTWTAFTDAGSGLDHYEYALGTTLGGTQARGWTVFTPNAGPSFTLTGLTLTGGTTYYPSIRAYDRAGNFTTLTGNGWLVDTTAPQAPTGLNDGTATSAASASPIASWTASTDVGSGIARYELAIGSSAGGTDLLNWTSVGNVTSASQAGLTLSPGMTYYTSVRASDQAGNVSAAALGDGWTYTLQGPTTLVFMPMDHAGPTTTDNSSVDFVNFANAGVHLRPVQNPSISTVAPKYGAGSGAFQNGSLQTGSSTANVIGNSDFTLEFWVKHSSLGFFGSPVISGSGWDISLGNTGYNNSADFAYYPTQNSGYRHWGGDIGWGVLPANTWNHLSISRSGTTLYTHLNGVLKQTVTIAAGARLEGTAAASTLTVGGHPSYIDDLRITVGGVTHTTANFTPTQLTPLPFLYLPMDGPGSGELPTADFRNMVPGGVSLSASGAPLITPAASACGGCGDFTAGTLSTPVSAANALGTRDFTLEFWVKHSSLDPGNSPVLSGGNGTTTFWDISLGNTVFNGNANFAFYATQMGGNRGWGGDISWGVLPRDTWTHLSLTRKGTSLITHKNGILVETVTILATDRMEGPNTTSAITIGGYPASLDDVMLTVGAARHTTANFPVARVPSTPRPVTVEPHVLLPLDGANGSTAFPNFAANGVTFSAVAAPAITTAAARYGGASGNFQSGSLTTATTSGNVIGTRDFTIEFWVNFSALSGAFTPVVAGNGWMISLGNTNYNNSATFNFANQSDPWGGPVEWGVLPRNTWTHLAVSRFQDRLYTHKNGVLVSVTSIAPTAHMEGGATTSALQLGQSPSYLDDVQITIGSAKYTTANFGVAPQLTRPFMHFPMDGANLSASFPNHGTGPAVTTVDSPTLTTAGALHGGASANFTAGSLTTAASSGYRLGAQDFTIEFWVKNPGLGLTGSPVIYGSGWDISLGNRGYNNNADFAYYPTENSGYRHWGGDIGWGVLPLNTWVHLSLSRTGTGLYTHKNGVLVSTLTIPATAAMEGPNATSTLVIGGHPSYVDDLQVTIGKARHTRANFNVFP
ncbi:kelch repeat-containing protein [Hyalangium minutum]